MTDTITLERRSEIMSHIKNKKTSIEFVLRPVTVSLQGASGKIRHHVYQEENYDLYPRLLLAWI